MELSYDIVQFKSGRSCIGGWLTVGGESGWNCGRSGE
jgi:hypothetical protein